MNWFRFFLHVLLQILRALAYGWIVAIVKLLKRLCRILKAFCAYLKLSHWQQEITGDECCQFTNPAYHRPDPCIYDQYYLMSLNIAVTWDNPDISLLRNGVVVSETQLLPNTQYEIDATIWNNSFLAPVAGMQVNFGYLSFGASTVLHPIGSTLVNLGVKGGPGCPALAKMLWTTPATPGHYCIQVQFSCPDDSNPNNNLGQNNVQVVPAQSPANFTFTLRNQTKTANTYNFEVDTYAIPAAPPCPETIAQNQGTFAERLKKIQAIHDRANFPVPAGWTVQITPPEVALASGDETQIAVSVTPPTGFVGTVPFNFHAMYGKNYAGGVTVYVSKT
jgi:hypothetical protein